ncbi:conserved hypothetical protein [Methanolacinia petrolearia DSM 11571]|uniref:CARDB domain-containing protein n=1 Tax=Methanolacinia petrolearia (strain DSM 11571 / OCM 486 / SEBR 4847) TaxID=679926 RepID=E1RFW7_METP4|nr:CARDB domain-containing protein [Methanolacinia petrolearia]ADN35119.1 conserved hypothetical protein [Methanolacinia petrolearia DSM 11571]
MKRINIFLILLVLFAAIPFIAAADDSEDSSYTDVTVTSVEYDPEVFMPGDEGTITITVKNTGDESVTISRAEIYSQDVTNLNDEAYDTVGALGAGNSMEFTFNVKAPLKEGIYYPRFYLDFYGSSGLSYNVPVKVDDTGLTISVINSPDAWQEDVSKSIQIRVGNPSQVTADGVIIYASGDGIESDQTSFFVGALEPNEYVDVTFEITPSKETTLKLNAEWNNGMNSHTSEISVPVEFGEDTTGADLVINNVEVSGGTVTGDVSNAGLEDAYSVIVTVGSPAEAIEPYKQYVLGSLESDDFSSFEVTYSIQGSSSSFPLVITWKDENGNTYSSEYTVSASSSGMAVEGDDSASSGGAPSGMGSGGPSGGGMGMMGMSGAGFANMPIAEIIIGLIIVIGLVVAWKKGYLAKAVKVVKEKLNKGDRK